MTSWPRFSEELPESIFEMCTPSIVGKLQFIGPVALALLDVCGRVRNVLDRLAEEHEGTWITDRLTHQELANMVGSSRKWSVAFSATSRPVGTSA